MQTGNIGDLVDVAVSHDPAIKKKILVGNSEIPHITQIAEVIFKPMQVAKSHIHLDMYEFFLVLEGEGTFMINNQKYQVGQGSYFICEPEDSHEVANYAAVDLKIQVIGVKK